MTMARTIKLYKQPDQPATPGLRPMEDRDVPQVLRWYCAVDGLGGICNAAGVCS